MTPIFQQFSNLMMRLSRGGQQLLEVLKWYGGRFKRVHPFQSKLAEHLSVSPRQIRRYVRELADALLLRVHKYGQHAAEYELAPEALTANVRSASGLRPVQAAASSSMNISAPHTARADKKPPQRESICERMIRKLLAEEAAAAGHPA